MIVCHCRVVSDRVVRESIQNGAADVATVMADTGAGTCCGGCLVTVEELVADADGGDAAEIQPRQQNETWPNGMKPLNS